MSNIANIAGALIALAAISKLTDRNAAVAKPTPLIPTAITKPTVTPVTRPMPRATRAEPITPFKTVQQRAEEAAFIARQQKMTREELIGKGPSGYLSL